MGKVFLDCSFGASADSCLFAICCHLAHLLSAKIDASHDKIFLTPGSVYCSKVVLLI